MNGVSVRRKVATKSVGNLVEALLVVADRVTVSKTEGITGCEYNVEATFYAGPLCNVKIIEVEKPEMDVLEIEDARDDVEQNAGDVGLELEIEDARDDENECVLEIQPQPQQPQPQSESESESQSESESESGGVFGSELDIVAEEDWKGGEEEEEEERERKRGRDRESAQPEAVLELETPETPAAESEQDKEPERKSEQSKESERAEKCGWVVSGNYAYRIFDGRLDLRYGKEVSSIPYGKARAIFDDLPDVADTSTVIEVAKRHGVPLSRSIALALMRAFGYVDFGAEFTGGGRRGNRARVVKCEESGFLRDENLRKVAVERDLVGTSPADPSEYTG